MNRPLEGRVALVTGAGVRLGKALAVGLARAGATVAIHYNASEEQAKQTLAEIETDGNRCALFRADLSQPASIEPLVEAVESQLGPISVLVNSAANFHRAPFVETTLEAFDSAWTVNARAPFLLSQAVAKRMLGREGGDILNMGDVGGSFAAWVNYSAHCMSKAAITMLTRVLAVELAPKIRVNAIAPGTVLPPEKMDDATLNLLRERIPQKRFGSPEDVVQTALFLLTGPRFVTGQVVAVDGGRSVGIPPGAPGSDVA